MSKPIMDRAGHFHRRHWPIGSLPLKGFLSVNFNCGRHSGIPLCCIRYFIFTWMLGPHEERRAHAARLVSTANRMQKWWGYIPCPDCCLTHEPVEVLSCPPGSHETYSCGSNTVSFRRHRRRGFVARRLRPDLIESRQRSL